MLLNTRSQSQVIGSVLLISLVVVTAGIIGYATLDLTEPTSQPSADLNVDIDPGSDSITVDHQGGETLVSEDLTVVVGDENGDQTRVDASTLTGSADGNLSAGQSVTDTEAVGNLDGELATVSVVHEPSGTVVEQQTIQLANSDGEAGSYAGGSGTESDPYIIADVDDLQSMRHNKSEYFKLGENIEGSIGDYLNDDGFEPIGSDGSFTGSLDGNGYEIRNLNVNQTGDDPTGLFGTIGSSGEVSNLTLSNAEISGDNYVGSVAGNNSGIINNVVVDGQSTTGENTVGGLVGFNSGEIRLSTRLNGTVTGTNNVGGAVGTNTGLLDDTHSNATVEGNGTRIGGLVGYNDGGGIESSSATGSTSSTSDSGSVGGLVGQSDAGYVEASYSTGDVTGGQYVGGLVGRNTDSDLTNTYSQSAVDGPVTAYMGGLIGFHEEGSTAESSYATGTVPTTPTARTDGLVGLTDRTTTVTDGYWDRESTGQQTTIPASEDFTGQPGDWVTKGDAVWGEPIGATTSSTLLLTENNNNEAGVGLYDAPVKSSTGFVTEFDYYANDGQAGGDGLTFFLVDGSTVDGESIQAGGDGDGLGYTGISDAYLGVGLDEGDDLVRLRAGDENNYNQITSQSPSQAIDGGWRTARVTVVPEVDQTTVTVELSWDNGENWETVLENEIHSQTPPEKLKFGFSGSTGTETNTHAVSSVDVAYTEAYDASSLSTAQMQGKAAASYLEGFDSSVWQVETNPDEYPTFGNGSWDPQPVAVFSASPNPAKPTEQIEFDASDSLNTESYEWDFKDNTTIVDGNIEETHSYDQIDEFNVTLTVTGADNSTATTTRTVDIKQAMDGSGTVDDPFEITSFHQLEDIQYSLDSHYEIVQDITPATTSEWDSSENFDSIGDSGTPFTGTLDGNGYTIQDLRIDTADDQAGLFGYTGSNATIRNVTISNADVSGGDKTGVLVGTNSGTIENASTSGAVNGGDYVGGLVGENRGTIRNSDSSVTIGASTTAGGGLVGLSSGTVTESYATGTIAGGSGATGGLIGQITGGTVSQSYATGSVTSGTYKGGLVGRNTGSAAIENSYARGTVPSGTHIGGLVGSNEDSASITSSYATGSVEGGSTNGLVGTDSGGDNIADSYWDTESTGQSGSAGDGALGLTTAQMQGDSAPTYMSFPDSLWTTTSGYPELGAGSWTSNPSANFSISPTDPEINEQITFDGSGSSDTKYYEWDFDDGTTSATSMDSAANHTYTSPGTYTVTLTSENADGDINKKTHTVDVYGYPEPSVTASDTLVTEGDAVDFDGTGSTPNDSRAQYNWEFGDGTTISDGSDSETHSYSSPGTYTAELTVINGASNQSSDTVEVEVVEAPNAVISGKKKLTKNKEYSWDGDDSIGASSYDWNIGSGPAASHTFRSTGSHQVRLTVTNRAGDSDTDTLGVTVYQAPDAVIKGDEKGTVGDRLTFRGIRSTGASSYDWNIHTGAYPHDGHETWYSSGNKKVELTVTNGAGDSNTATRWVTIYAEPVARISGPTTVTEGTSSSWDGDGSSGASSYKWSVKDGFKTTPNIGTYSKTAYHTFSNTGGRMISLTVTNGAGDSHTTSKPITVNPDNPGNFVVQDLQGSFGTSGTYYMTYKIKNTGDETGTKDITVGWNSFDVLPRLKTRESHGTAPLSWDITVRGSRPVLVG
jgi:PKD repeat protein